MTLPLGSGAGALRRLPVALGLLVGLVFGGAGGGTAGGAQMPGGAAASNVAASNVADREVAARRAEVRARAGEAGAIVPLLGVLDLWDQVDDRGAIVATLDEVRSDPRQRPDVRGRAAFLRSIAADRMGDTETAERLRASLGLLRSFWVVGPFDNDARSGEDTVYPPEKEPGGALDLAAHYPGKQGEVAWRRFPSELLTQGMVPLDAVLRPATNGVAYVSCFVRVASPTVAALRTGSTGPVKAWVNGEQVLSRDAYRPLRIDQDAAGVRLRAGWNRITLKLSSADDGWGLFARLTAPDGGPLAFTEWSAEAPPAQKDLARPKVARKHRRGPKAGPVVVADLGRDLADVADGRQPVEVPSSAGRGRRHRRVRRIARHARKQEAQQPDVLVAHAHALRDLGLYLHYVAPDDRESDKAEKALSDAADLDPTLESYRDASLAARGDKGRKWLEDGLALAGADKASPALRASVLTDLGDDYARLSRGRLAEKLWKRAMQADPGCVRAEVRLAELVSDRGLPALAQQEFDALQKQHPTLGVLEAQARLAERLDPPAAVEKRWDAVLGAEHDDLTALRALLAIARDRGDVDGALRWLDRMQKARPDLLSLSLDRADLLDGVGRSKEAHAVLERALRASPDDTRLLERDGRVLRRLGRAAEALARFRRSLSLRPQNPDLRAYVRALDEEVRGAAARKDASAGDDLAKKYARKVEDLIAAAKERDAKKPAVATGGDSARVLLDLQATRVHTNGLSESFHQRVVQVLEENAARDQGVTAIRYTPDTQTVEVKEARVYRKDGEVVEAVAETDEDTSEPWYGLYYDTRAEVIELPKLSPGDVVDVEYVVSDVARENMFGDYFGDLHLMQESLPRLESDYVLLTPKSRAFYFNQPRLPSLRTDEKVVGDERIYSFRATDVPKIDDEPLMPGPTDVAAYVHVSTYKTWEAVAAWYQGLIREQLEPDDAIRRAVKQATAGITDERQKIRAIYDLVVKETRYVGLEFGIHGYKPYTVGQIFQRKFGDCKDKASLLVAMLRVAGIQATLALARTRRGGDIDPFPASLAVFDHAIAYVPKYDLFLDGTAEFSGSDELPAQDQDIPVLLVSDPRIGGKGRLARTPVLPPADNLVKRDLDVSLSPSGEAKVDLHLLIEGQHAQEWREAYQSPGGRREKFEQLQGESHPGARVTKIDFPDLEDLEKPVLAHASLDVPGWAHRDDARGGLTMPALGREGEMAKSFARQSERSYDLVLGFPWEQQERVSIALPPGYSVRSLPAARSIKTPFGSFSVRAVLEKGRVLLTGSLEVVRHRIHPKEYPAFRRFCLAVDEAARQQLVLSRDQARQESRR